MASYNLRYIVINGSSNAAITNVSVTHECAKVKTPIATAQLGPGEATRSVNIVTKDGSNDYWSVQFTDGGGTKARSDKQCNLLEKDENQDVVIVLYPANFSVLTPQSDPCLNNHY
jgi:hypothetical protein